MSNNENYAPTHHVVTSDVAGTSTTGNTTGSNYGDTFDAGNTTSSTSAGQMDYGGFDPNSNANALSHSNTSATVDPSRYGETLRSGSINPDGRKYNNVSGISGEYNTDALREGDLINQASSNFVSTRQNGVDGPEAAEHAAGYRDSVSLPSEAERDAPLASTEGPYQNNQPESDSIGSYSSVSSRNAPGKEGKVGEAVLGAFGYGGSHVERDPKDRGIGEKIANFLGA